MPIRKIDDEYRSWQKKKMCLDPDHNIPSMISLPPGTYEHLCPSCGRKQVFVVTGARL